MVQIIQFRLVTCKFKDIYFILNYLIRRRLNFAKLLRDLFRAVIIKFCPEDFLRNMNRFRHQLRKNLLAKISYTSQDFLINVQKYSEIQS